mmetsp:Transcript_5588/g.8258  ORF Transcript_5588/g.8258 Transcript_5588/m.8258 type:complete len:203 (+) Transcript_5588:120-728(+)
MISPREIQSRRNKIINQVWKQNMSLILTNPTPQLLLWKINPFQRKVELLSPPPLRLQTKPIIWSLCLCKGDVVKKEPLPPFKMKYLLTTAAGEPKTNATAMLGCQMKSTPSVPQLLGNGTVSLSLLEKKDFTTSLCALMMTACAMTVVKLNALLPPKICSFWRRGQKRKKNNQSSCFRVLQETMIMKEKEGKGLHLMTKTIG